MDIFIITCFVFGVITGYIITCIKCCNLDSELRFLSVYGFLILANAFLFFKCDYIPCYFVIAILLLMINDNIAEDYNFTGKYVAVLQLLLIFVALACTFLEVYIFLDNALIYFDNKELIKVIEVATDILKKYK